MDKSINIGRKAILVTGGTGFIGRQLVNTLLERGARVRVLIRSHSPVPAPWEGKIALAQGDLEDIKSLSAACRGVDTVFHAAGFAHAGPADSRQDLPWRVNALGTRNLLEAAAGAGEVERLVFLSSVKAMGEGGRRCIDETWPVPPRTAYGKAKRAAEQWVIEAGQRGGIHVVNLRLAMVYGPGGRGNLERMVEAIRRGWFPPLPAIANQRSMVHVSDVVQAALLAAADPRANRQTYILTDGRSYSSREIYDLIRRGLGKRPARWSVPYRLLRAVAGLGDGLGRLLRRPVGLDSEMLDKLLGWACYRSDKIQRELGYRPSRTLSDSLPEILVAEAGLDR